jgi:glycine C-acetyltransferase
MIGDAALLQPVADRLLTLGVYVIRFFYLVVPQGTAWIRTQVSAAIRKKTHDLRSENSPKSVKNTGLNVSLLSPK